MNKDLFPFSLLLHLCICCSRSRWWLACLMSATHAMVPDMHFMYSQLLFSKFLLFLNEREREVAIDFYNSKKKEVFLWFSGFKNILNEHVKFNGVQDDILIMEKNNFWIIFTISLSLFFSVHCKEGKKILRLAFQLWCAPLKNKFFS